MKKLNMKKFTSLVVTLIMVFTLILPVGTISASAEAKTFDIIEVTDFHGTLQDTSDVPNPVGAVLVQNIKDVEKANPDRTLVLSGGDLYQGSAISNYLKGVPVQQTMDAMGLDVTAIGNHEFDWGIDTLLNTTMKNAKYSIVCANIYDKTTGKRAFAPYKIFEKDGVKIAVIGAATLETPSIVLPSYVKNYDFKDPVTEINGLVSEVKAAGATVVLALIHEGTNQADVTNKTGAIYDITNKLVGVDAVFGGHSHTQANYLAANGIPVYIAKSNGKGYIDAKMTIDAAGKASFVCTADSYVAIDTDKANGYKNKAAVQDPDVKAIVDAALKEVGPTIDVVIGNNDKDYTTTQNMAPYGESTLGNWCTDAMRAWAHADVAFQNNGGLRTNFKPGQLMVKTIYAFMPFDNTVCYVDMTKAQIKVVLEQAFADNGKGIQFSGLRVKYDSTRKTMDRVISITRGDGTPISDTEKLSVVTNDFMMTGGDGFKGFVTAGGSVNNVVVNNSQYYVRDVLIEAVKASGKIDAYFDGRLANAAKSINVIATSDLHGSILPFSYSTMAEDNLGLAKISTYVKKQRATNPGRVMLIDNGDTIQGTPLATYYNLIDTTAEYPMMKAMGAMHYDTWNLGNHEFNYGLDVLKRITNDAKKEGIRVLSGNIYNTYGGGNLEKPYLIKSFVVNGKLISVAILGLTTKAVPNWEDAAHYKGVYFNDVVKEADKWTKQLKAMGVDIVIASIHGGIANATSLPGENQVEEVAKNVSGIDAIVAGHTHKAIAQNVYTNPEGKKVIVTEPLNTDKIFSQIDINIDANGNIASVSSKNVTSDVTTVADPEIVALAQPYQDATLKYVDTLLGTATDEFNSKNVEFQPIALMDLINKVQMDATGAQLSIAAPLNGTALIPKGDIKIRDLMGVYVFENFLYGVKMNGKQIKAWMEKSMYYYKQAKEGEAPAKDTVLNTALYNLDVLYGATYDVDLTQPAGSRIKNLKYQGKLIKDDDTFTVAINNYRFNGGGGFMEAAGLTPKDTSIVVYDSAKKLGDDGQIRTLMMEYIKKNKTITPTVEPSWKLSTTPVVEEK